MGKVMKILFSWTTIIPLLAWGLYLSGFTNYSVVLQIVATILLLFSVMAAVHFSETIAHRVGEPFGTIILAIAITIIEVSIIVSLMASGGQDAAALARDTVFSAVMLILNGIVGLSIFIGALKFHEQGFSTTSATIPLVSIVSIVTLTLVLPSFSTSINGPYYSMPQLVFVSIACLIIYSFFLFAQTTRHRVYFISENEEPASSIKTGNRTLIYSLIFLLVSLGIVVLMAKTLSPVIEKAIVSNNLPQSLVGVIIAAVILLPEGAAAIIAAKNNNIQVSLNLALGSAMASIGLTIPSVAIVSYIYDMKIILGLDIKSIILLGLSVFIVLISLSGNRTNIVYGAVLLVNLLAYIFLIIYP